MDLKIDILVAGLIRMINTAPSFLGLVYWDDSNEFIALQWAQDVILLTS